MHDPRRLKVVKETTSIYPGKKNARVVDFVGGVDNKIYTATIENAEADLLLYLKCSIFPELNQSQQDKLLKLIEEYGDMRYEKGAFDESYDG